MAAQDDAVRGTNEDAVQSKCSAVDLGYMKDPFVKHFVRRKTRRPPVINRGSYIRFEAINALINVFLDCTKTSGFRQILSLGAGSDTRRWLLHEKKVESLNYFELDFPEITAKKVGVIRKNAELLKDIVDLKYVQGGTGIHSSNYTLLGTDIRDFNSSTLPLLEKHGFDTSLPTLVIAGCVLVYLEPSVVTGILSSLASHLKQAVMIGYDPIRPDDSFGRMMVANLKDRNLELPSFTAFGDLETQQRRFLDNQWTFANALDMNQIYESWTTAEEKNRISQVEQMDELEEWKLLTSHYALSWAVLDKDSSGIFDIYKGINFTKIGS